MKKYITLKRIVGALLIATLLCASSVCWAACGPSDATDKYTVTFVYNDGATANVAVRVAAGEKVSEPTAPARDGYAFDGWYDSAALSAEYDFGSPVTKNISLYAKWSEQYVVTFVFNDGVTPDATAGVAAGGKVVRPADPTRAEHTFAGWFVDAALTTPYDFDAAVSGAVSLYAKWTPDVCTVTFVYNDGVTADGALKIAAGGKVAAPATPTRVGYTFGGWFTDEALTAEYDFDAAVSDNITLYAFWMENGVTYRKVTLHYNDGVTPDAVLRVKDSGRAQQPQTPTRADHEFLGWYSDDALTTKFIFSTKITADVDLYVKWGGIYVFEAEDTDISGIIGKGYSGNATGSDIIGRGAGSSNGFYLTYLYNIDIEIVFKIYSDADVGDAKLYLSLSAEYADFTIDGDSYKVMVNDAAQAYQIKFENVPVEQNAAKKPFADYLIAASVPLNAGVNTIKLVTNNSTPLMGTMSATAPMVDCVRLVSASELRWDTEHGYPFDNTSMLT